ncbi:hypothetical protein J1N35_041423 [Gossypium stocksii]|uniref:Uncharacterized protein n=1 Tax=Gossypium stocksii TaxID=47602 RepID=A0A9D3UFU8_9ROSI|nr:hypothetical protein J1N35_041423 [Gossypium stocksii]
MWILARFRKKVRETSLLPSHHSAATKQQLTSAGKDWENFKMEWKQSVDFFIPTGPEVEEEDSKDSTNLEEVPRERPHTERPP